ncbi:hypothetical protein SEA_LEWANDO_46 [Arthrobacter phage Lewando]|nr:hypothetical protein SEA_LEWANDO_46 [Arthrobacter phage Lewando]
MAHNITNLVATSDLKRKAAVFGGMILGGLITAAVTHTKSSTAVVPGVVVPDEVHDAPVSEPTESK